MQSTGSSPFGKAELPDNDSPGDPRGGLLGWLLRLWFGMNMPVSRPAYAFSGIGLMAFKYLVEAVGIWVSTGSAYWPWHFFNPMISARFAAAQGVPDWLGWAWFVWTLPFLWIGITMSVRRSADAGLSPWLGFLMLVPVTNLLFMIGMCFVPTRQDNYWAKPGVQSGRPSGKDAVMAIGASVIFGGVMLVFSVYVLSSYGASLFLGTPMMMGAIAAYLYNRRSRRGHLASVGVGMGSVFFAGVALLLFALEGVICIFMAMPVMLPLGAFGAFVGKAIADASRWPQHGLAVCVAALPLLAVVEAYWQPTTEYVVVSMVEVDAPPEVVWENVVHFPDLPPDTDWFFRLGVASPQRARIEGQGVGATRYCEFTTGAFVEPITVWDPPQRLAFNVTDQPAPMFELSPYDDLHPPHLDGFMRSNRGEFKLIALDGGRTRLEGRTWYEVEMFPQWYWTLWSDSIIHRIHLRVLRHVQRISED